LLHQSDAIMADRYFRAGGHLQRVARARAKAAAADAPSCTYKSKLVEHLLELNAWKHITPQLVQKICELARQDALILTNAIMIDVAADVAMNGANAHVPDATDIHRKIDAIMPSLHTAANAGTFGRNVQNVGRSLTDMTRSNRFAGITRMSLPMKVPGIVHCKSVLQDVLLPHRSLAEMYHRFPASFAARICPSSDRLFEFWTACANHPSVARIDHLLRDVPDWRRKCIPLKLHVDAVPVVGVGKSWSILVDKP
jgi:hypothetical protein